MTSEIEQAKAALEMIKGHQLEVFVQHTPIRGSHQRLPKKVHKTIIKALQARIEADVHKPSTCSADLHKKDENIYRHRETEPFEPDPKYTPVLPDWSPFTGKP